MVGTASHLVVAGVNKAGTTSLFVGLSAHPGIAPAAVKETRYFLPARYGRPLEPPAVYDEYFTAARPGQVRLEATPSYFYGGADVARAIVGALPAPAILLMLREPVARAISFFRYQKARLRFPADLPIEDYLARADALDADAFQDPANEPYMAVRGGRYADFLPGWLEVNGVDRVRVVAFEDFVAEPARVLGGIEDWLGLDPDPAASSALAPENRTTGFRSARLQRLALLGNDRLERVLRRHPELKRRARAFYYRINGRTPEDPVSDAVRADLAARFTEPNARLARQLAGAGFVLPPWLDAPRPDVTSPPRDPGRESTR
jgi:hypothetical protein